MRVIHLSTNDARGGAARAARRLHQGLRSLRVDSRIKAQKRTTDDPRTSANHRDLTRLWNRARPRLDRGPLRLYPNRLQVPYSLQWLPSRIQQSVETLAPDVVNLHWVCGGFVDVGAIHRMARPLVWTLHDMWPFTGGCHYDEGCRRYVESCGRCPQLGSHRELDLSRWTWWRKKRAWDGVDLTIVTPSKWLAALARESSLFHDRRIEVIPNGLDVDRFKPVQKEVAAGLLNLPADAKLILFGAMSATTNRRKGFDLLRAALPHLPRMVDGQSVNVVVMGAREPEKPVDLGVPGHYLGTLRDDVSLNLAYACADVFVAPSRQDNLPNTVVEALACGVPCVAFDIGGMPDMIEHKQTGYLAEPFDPEDLANGIQWVQANEERWRKLSRQARLKGVREFDQELQARRYVELYREILAARA